MNSPAAGDRILSTDVSGIVNFLTGVSGSGQALTLIYNAAGAIALQPSSDPAVSTQLVQVKNNAGTVKFAIRADGSLVFSDATIQTTAGIANPMTTVGDVITGGASGVAGRLAIGTTGQVLTVTAGAPAWATAAVAGITLATEQATTAGTSIDFTGIPTGTKRITVMFNGVSTNGTSNIIIQIGKSAGVEITGYLGVNTALGLAGTAFTSGFIMAGPAVAASLYYGKLILTLENSANNVWAAMGGLADPAGATTYFVAAGIKPLAGVLDRVRLTTAGGANTFDAGAVNIAYE